MSMHVSKGDRTFTKDKDSYGVVTRSTMFGVSTNSSVIQLDDGTFRAYIGDTLKEQIVNTTTNKDGNGTEIVLPTDVKSVGPSILASMGIPARNQVALFQKFMVLDKATRRQKMKEWSECISEENCDAFLADFLSILEDDTLYIQTYSAILLDHLDADLRAQMLSDFFAATTADQRVDLINEFAGIKKSKKKTETFLQKIYSMLLDDDTYWAMQMKVFGKNVFKEPDLSNKIIAYMADTSQDSRRAYYLKIWRKNHIYNTSRAVRWVKYFLRRY